MKFFPIIEDETFKSYFKPPTKGNNFIHLVKN